jgi:hypothetical protein
MSLVNVACNEVKIAVNKLNSRPRKCLGFKTPYQVFFERTGIDARHCCYLLIANSTHVDSF